MGLAEEVGAEADLDAGAQRDVDRLEPTIEDVAELAQALFGKLETFPELGDLVVGGAACTCASINPGIRTRPPASITTTSVPARSSRPSSATSTIRSPSTRSAAPGLTSPATGSRSLAFVISVPGIGASLAPANNAERQPGIIG
jgi:hypothetical protein